LDSAYESRERRDLVASSAISSALRHLLKAKEHLTQSVRRLRNQRFEECDEHFARASDEVAEGLEALSSPTHPGVSGDQLPPRDSSSSSVKTIGNLEEFKWLSDRMGYSKDRERQQVSNELNALAVQSRKLSSGSILAKLADSGWGPEELGQYVADLMDTVKGNGTIRQKVEVLKLLKDMIQHTEPRTLFEMKDVDLADLTEEELEELTRSAAQHVAQESARLQAGLPARTTEG
jgi:hypothetical protein